VEWAERDAQAGFDLEPIVQRTPDAYEASCWLQYNEGRIETALAAAREWLMDESYATRSVGMVCYLASFLDDYETVIQTARAALVRHPDEVLHRNNLIYALFTEGSIFDTATVAEIAEHIDFLRRRINAREDDAFHSTANAGLFFYRNNQPNEGRQLYNAVMEAAEKSGNHLTRAHAAVMNSREAILAGAPWAKEALDVAHKLTAKVHSPGLSFYLRKLDALALNPANAANILVPTAAKRFTPPRRRTDPLRDFRVEQTESGPVLWVPRHLLKR
jgi:hypothetical protein